MKPDVRYYYTKRDRLSGDMDLLVYLNSLLTQIGSQSVSTGASTTVEVPVESLEVTPCPTVQDI